MARRTGVVLKLGIAVMFMLLLGPYIFHLKLSNRLEDDAQMFKEWQNRENQAKHPQETVLKAGHMQVEEAQFKDGVNGNFEPGQRDISDAPGDGGEAVSVSSEQQALAQQTIKEFGFNMVASDQVPMDRVIPDTRLDECKYWHYPTSQPTASVILVFHNEGFSTLVRTIHSVINMSPGHLLHEVVLVDDASTKDQLQGKLETYIEQFGDTVKLYRNEKREGLIRTRSRGAELSTGDVIIFLDAHCECNRNWIVPLLDRVRRNRKTMAVPIIDSIHWDTMAYRSVYGKGSHSRGIFEWGFLYKENTVPKQELMKRTYNSEPYRSPTHAGGLFAMDRAYFNELGGYDPGLQIWGGENYELSFKIWQCGGTIEWVPCSKVGHIYRNFMPYTMGDTGDAKMSPININYMRVVAVWMDPEYMEFFYTREPSLRGYDFGNVTKQLQFKKDHKCKSFKWFMDNIAYDVYTKFPAPPPNKAWGEIKLQGENRCVDSGFTPVGVGGCHGQGASQMFRLNVKGQLATGERCILAKGVDTLQLSFCPTGQPTGPWQYDETTGAIRHQDLNKCITAGDDDILHLKSCNSTASFGKWEIRNIYPWKRA